MNEVVKFNNFQFNYNLGELTYTPNKKEKKVIRLSPQSAKLLHALIRAYPEMVSKDKIKSLLWQNVEVDFDNSLHFCIRQIRIALQDDVSNPKYIETIPRRGYRWLVKVEEKKKKRIRIQLAVAIVLLITTSIGINYHLSNKNQEREVAGVPLNKRKIRLIIMPLQPTDSSNLFYKNGIAYDLLNLFAQINELEVIGPTTTQNINQENLYNFFEDSKADFIINGKFSNSEHESRLLVEIIRKSDKAHVWVVSFNTDSIHDQITHEIYNGFIEQMVRFNKK